MLPEVGTWPVLAHPEVERLCMVCDMLVDGQRGGARVPVLSRRDVQPRGFTYTEVAAILANTRGPEASKRKDRVKDRPTCTTCTARCRWRANNVVRWILKPPEADRVR